MTANHSSTTCTHLDDALAEYLAGRLPDREAAAIEQHASTCARCEGVLDRTTQRVHHFEPTLPSAVRDATLRQVRAKALGRQRTARIGWTSLAAAAVLTIGFSQWRAVNDSPAVDMPTVASGDVAAESLSRAADGPRVVEGRMGAASFLAETQAEAEFAELDAAARELEDALRTTPADRELREFLRTVNARRDELTRRVREATS